MHRLRGRQECKNMTMIILMRRPKLVISMKKILRSLQSLTKGLDPG